MKKVAVTALVLALGLAACNKNTDNNAANETAVENNAEYDVNAATNDAAASADAALNDAGNAVENAGNAVDNASNAVENATTNH
jgi:predicted small secreted protein